MILGEIQTYYVKYLHKETGRLVEVVNASLQVKTDRHWQTCIVYRPEDANGNEFAVPVDDFRKRFEVYKEPEISTTPE